MVTISHIAKLAGVGNATVSRVLNNTGNVSPEVRERVLALSKEKGYVPNQIARNLKAGHTKSIAFITTTMENNSTFSDILRGLNSVLFSEGYTICVLETKHSVQTEMNLVNSVVSQWVDGIVLSSSVYEENDETTEYLESLGNLRKKNIRIPVVQLGIPCLNKAVSSVGFCHEEAAYRAVYHLIEIGRKNIVYVSIPECSAAYVPRLDGYKRAMKEAGLTNIHVVPCDFSLNSAYRAMNNLLESGHPVDAIFGGNDGIALGVIAACKDNGIRVPEDIAVIGNDDSFFSSFMDPQISTVRIPRFTLGKKAGEVLFKLMNNQDSMPEAENLIFDTEIQIRSSTLKSAGSTRRCMDWVGDSL